MASRGFELPPRLLNSGGAKRRVGFEFEYAGVGLSRSCDIVIELFGGRKIVKNRFHYKVIGTRFGDFSIESDSSHLKNRKYGEFLKMLGVDIDSMPLGQRIEDLIEAATQDLVPFEIVTPPIPVDELETMEHLRERLWEADAKGTYAHFYSAYGMQFNPEVPAFDVTTLLGYMRAFLLLYDQLLASEEVPLMRRALPYIDEFPEEYFALALDPGYDPDLGRFMRDYLDFNPTRNRPLDWLPLFTYLNPDLVFQYEVEKPLIKPRPTLHYRLPSSLIDDPKWSISSEWNKWNDIERLAAEPEKLRLMSRDWQEIHGPLSLRSESRWLRKSQEWIHGDHA